MFTHHFLLGSSNKATKDEWEGENKLGVWDEYKHTTIYKIGRKKTKDLLYSPGNYTEYLVITYNGKRNLKKYI